MDARILINCEFAEVKAAIEHGIEVEWERRDILNEYYRFVNYTAGVVDGAADTLKCSDVGALEHLRGELTSELRKLIHKAKHC